MRDRAALVDALVVRAWQLHAGDAAGAGRAARGRRLRPRRAPALLRRRRDGAAAAGRGCRPGPRRSSASSRSSGTSGSRPATASARIDDCRQEALADLGVATTLFEARLLAGPPALFDAMRRALAPDRLWSSRDFFDAKLAEQAERHHRFHDTAYNLEPNVKQGPGGCATSRPSPGWPSAISASTRSANSHGPASCAARARAAGIGAVLAVARALRAAPRERAARGPAAVRPPDPPGADVRLRGRDLHARRRAVHAALLPHGDAGRLVQRAAAAAVPRGDRRRPRRPRAAARRHFQERDDVPRGRLGRRLRAPSVRIARAVPRAAAEPAPARRARAHHPARRREPVARSTRNSARTRAITACSSRSCARPPASRTSSGA